MSMWKYIGEFMLFRWLFGNRDTDRQHDAGSSSSVDTNDFSPWRSNYDDYSADDSYCSSLDNFHNEQDDYDMMDDDW